MEQRDALTTRRIARFWLPLALTWLMISVEGPFIAAIIARLPQPTPNLASYGVAFALAMLFESPIILIMSASTALVADRDSFLRLRRFTYALNAAITIALAVLVIPPVFRAFGTGLIGLPPGVADTARQACTILLPWPAAIGYRRFFQGLLIRGGGTRRVAYGTVVRLSSMATAALVARAAGLPGALCGASALVSGVVMEALAARFMARHIVRTLRGGGTLGPAPARTAPLDYGYIWRFYYPLALTSMLTLGVGPIVTFFLGQGRLPLESLAVMAVVNPLIFLFGSVGLAYQEVAIALAGERRQHEPELRRFAALLAGGASGVLAVIVVAPGVLDGVLSHVSGLTPALLDVARTPVRILVAMPALSVTQSFQRALRVVAHRTRSITVATAIEVTVIVILLAGGVFAAGLVGATAAACALLGGRIAAITFLLATRVPPEG